MSSKARGAGASIASQHGQERPSVRRRRGSVGGPVRLGCRCVGIDLTLGHPPPSGLARREIGRSTERPTRGSNHVGLQNSRVNASGIMYAGFPGPTAPASSPRSGPNSALSAARLGQQRHVAQRLVLMEREHLEPALGEGIPPRTMTYGHQAAGHALLTFLQANPRNALAGSSYLRAHTSRRPE